MKSAGLYFVLTTTRNVSPNTSLEFINRLLELIVDFCGPISLETIRKNFLLLYELIDEVMVCVMNEYVVIDAKDFGFPQDTSSDSLKMFINNTPMLEKKAVAPPAEEKKNVFADFFRFGAPKEKEPELTMSVLGPRKEELFVDIIEKMTLLIDGKVGTLTAHLTS